MNVSGQQSLPPPDKVELSAPVSVPMESATGLPVVSARINDHGPYKLIIDTGAGSSVFSESLAQELGFPSIAHAAMGRPGSTKPVAATVTRVEKIEIGSLTIEGVMAVYADLSAVFLKKAPDVQGVLSAAMVPGLLVIYNFPAKKIEFRRGELAAEDGQTIFAWPAGKLPSLTADVAGQSVQMDVDTGAISGFVVDSAVANKVKWLEAPSEGAKMRTVDTETKTFTGRINGTIRIGKFSFENPRLDYHDGFNNLGSAALKDFIVTLDPKNRRLELKRD
jgi:predicted aspartyl protease